MFHLNFPGARPMAKARPRLGQGFVHMPKPYVDWKYDFASSARFQWGGQPPIEQRCYVRVWFSTRTGNMRPDADNAYSAVLDALEMAGVISSDRIVAAGGFDTLLGAPGIRVELGACPLADGRRDCDECGKQFAPRNRAAAAEVQQRYCTSVCRGRAGRRRANGE